ncbi:hypothetical protein [Halopseudomonas pelagia]|uniref:hypothetical protein n=1 Tax=Halopseudomonas pelagia TaxID=553151 RepID=UPI001293EA18|nr:hypothetical protein [Halopseudomonas pelagia]
MKAKTENQTRKSKIPTQPPLHDFYMPAMPPTDLIIALAKWLRKQYRRIRQRGRSSFS